jgi:hypothetical protein
MVWNQTVELDENGDPKTSFVTATEVEAYVTTFVSQKSSLESLIDSSYEMTIDLAEMNLESMFIIYKFFTFIF